MTGTFKLYAALHQHVASTWLRKLSSPIQRFRRSSHIITCTTMGLARCGLRGLYSPVTKMHYLAWRELGVVTAPYKRKDIAAK